jgi:hypothetical protein
MAAAELTFSGLLYDKLNRTAQQVVLIGEATYTGLGVGGGPMPPGSGGQPQPPWWPGHPEHPIPPTVWPNPPSGGTPNPPWWPGHPEHPIPPVVGGGPIFPPNVPPGLQPPSPPNPGDPTTPIPPPAGSPGWPVQSIVPPPYIVVNYPGLGPVVVAPPAATGAAPA